MAYEVKQRIDNEKLGAEIIKLAEGRVAAAQADSVATTVADIVTDFNALLAKLRTAGLLAP